jgi:hypothetical protein
MSHTAPTSDGQISRVHSMALCQEIAERLRTDLDLDRPALPPHLKQLMQRFQQAG